MQLLGVTISLILIMAPLTSPADQGPERCDSVKTTDLLRCTGQNLDSADDTLNLNYRVAMRSNNARVKIKLRNTQRSWLRFRDSYCEDISDDTYPGAEAEVEKISCLAHLTTDRASEIERLYRQPNDDGYFQLISALERAGYDRTELLYKLQDSSNSNIEWVEYISLNCELLKEVNEEPIEKCKARNNIYRSH